MSIHTETQIITAGGKPAFAVIPIDEFEAIKPALEKHRALRFGIPNAVAKRIMIDDAHPVRAWREYLGLDQSAVAEKAGMKQPALARIESGTGGKTRKDTLARLAHAMGLNREQVDI
ncbi:MAG: helix-turn-helix transcriptional regulator [Mariprofundus sp.]